MDMRRALRVPPDVIKDSKNFVIECFILVLAVALIGVVMIFMGWTVDD